MGFPSTSRTVSPLNQTNKINIQFWLHAGGEFFSSKDLGNTDLFGRLQILCFLTTTLLSRFTQHDWHEHGDGDGEKFEERLAEKRDGENHDGEKREELLGEKHDGEERDGESEIETTMTVRNARRTSR